MRSRATIEPRGAASAPARTAREDIMKRDCWIVAFAAATWVLAGPAAAQTGTIERLYVLECGQGQVGDLSRWSPGVNVGKKTEFVTNCYLIKHAQGYMDVGDRSRRRACRRPGGTRRVHALAVGAHARIAARRDQGEACGCETSRGLAHPP